MGWIKFVAGIGVGVMLSSIAFSMLTVHRPAPGIALSARKEFSTGDAMISGSIERLQLDLKSKSLELADALRSRDEAIQFASRRGSVVVVAVVVVICAY